MTQLENRSHLATETADSGPTPSLIPHPSSFIRPPILTLCVILCLASALPALAVDQVTLRRDGKTIEVTGRS